MLNILGEKHFPGYCILWKIAEQNVKNQWDPGAFLHHHWRLFAFDEFLTNDAPGLPAQGRHPDITAFRTWRMSYASRYLRGPYHLPII
jgi:hypothetical protein